VKLKDRRGFIDELFGEVEAPTPIKTTFAVDQNLELDLESMVADAIDPTTRMVRDLRIDDRDFKLFPNYWEFSTSPTGLRLRPFARQLWALSMLFGEICPRCSNPKYHTGNILDVPLKIKSDAFPEHFQLLKHGKCPKCKATRLELLRAKEMMPYHELALLAGQRVGKTTQFEAPAAVYQLHRMIKLQRPYEVYDLEPTTMVGTAVAQTFANAYEQQWLPIKTYIEGCQWFCIAEGTPITLENGNTVPIEQIKPGDMVKTFEGSSKVLCHFDNGVRSCKEITLEDDKKLVATGDHCIRVLTPDGMAIMWKEIHLLTEDDYVVTED